MVVPLGKERRRPSGDGRRHPSLGMKSRKRVMHAGTTPAYGKT